MELDRVQAGESNKVLFNGKLISNETKIREWERYSFASTGRPEDLSPLPTTFDIEPLCPEPMAITLGRSTKMPNHSSDHNHTSEQDIHATMEPAIVGLFPSSQAVRGGIHYIVDTDPIQPFAWGAGFNWTSLTRALGSDKQITQVWRPDLNRLDSMFYSERQPSLTVAAVTDTLVLQHVVSSIINGMDCLQSNDQGDVYNWLAMLPRQVVLGLLGTLPAETVEVIRQRLRTAAVKASDAKVVQALLELECHLCTQTFHAEDDIFFVLDRLKTCSQAIAPIIARYVARRSSSQDQALQRMLNNWKASMSEDKFTHRTFDLMKPLKILVEAGAVLTHSWFLLEEHTTSTLEELLVLGRIDILAWLQDGLLVRAVTSPKRGSDRHLVTWILSALKRLFYQKVAQGIWTEDDSAATSFALTRAFQIALERAWAEAIEAIYDACQQIGCQTYYDQDDVHLNSTIMQACGERDWLQSYQSVPAARDGPEPFPAHADPAPRDCRWEDAQEALDEAMRSEDYRLIEDLLVEEFDPYDVLATALTSNHDVAAAVAASFCGQWGIIELLSRGKLRAISILLCRYSHWTAILQDAGPMSQHDRLEDALYRKEAHEDCRLFPCSLSLPRLDAVQIALRALGYHAIHQGDVTLLDWLYQCGLATEGVFVQTTDFGRVIIIVRMIVCQSNKLVESTNTDDCYTQCPSLVDVATKQQHVHTLRYLLSRRLPYRDSNALLYAVKAKAPDNTIRVLLEDRLDGSSNQNTQYGSAALRMAIRNKNYDLICILSPGTDIHGLEAIDGPGTSLDHLDPLGEAILQKDCTAVRILLDRGGDPNAIVAFDGLHQHAPRSSSNSVLLRMTALLVAIDIGDSAMVDLLVQSGANVNRDSSGGLLRTPLQRASEIGDFGLVQYFIAQGAEIDAAAVYGGGTALNWQL